MMIFHCRMLDCSLRYASFTASHSPCLFFSYPLLPYTRYCKKFRDAPFLQSLRLLCNLGPLRVSCQAPPGRVIFIGHFRCSCTCHYVSFAAMCHTHSHLQRHSENDGVLRHPRLPKQNNFPPGKLLCFINLPTLILSQTMLLHCPQQNKTEVVFRLPPLRPPPSFIIVWV